MPDTCFLGIDGCPAGWFCVRINALSDWSIDMVSNEAVGGLVASATTAFIDIPIGLLDDGPAERDCDRQSRRALGRPRGSSVFPAPARASLCASDFNEALQINRQRTGRGISKQCWLIAPKIKIVDEALQNEPSLRAILHESHPEVCFWALNGATAMRHSKKSVAGRTERMRLLHRFFPPSEAVFEAALRRYRRSQVAPDDVVDAMVLAASASLGAGHYCTFPVDPPMDATGLPMRIVFTEPSLTA